MNKKKKLKLRKFNLHPICSFILLTIGVFLLTLILAGVFKLRSSYKVVDLLTKETRIEAIKVNNLFTRGDISYLLKNSVRNLFSYKYFIYFLISGLAIAFLNASGFLDALFKRITKLFKAKTITFFVIFLSMTGTLLGDFTLAFLIPFVALLYKYMKRSPILGIVTVYAAYTFSYSINLFTGLIDYNLTSIASPVMNLIEEGSHISMLSTWFISVISIIGLSFVGTYISENLSAKRLPKYVPEDKDIEVLDEDISTDRLTEEKREKTAYIVSLISGLIVFLIYLYTIIPGLPASGFLLNLEQPHYLNQLFGNENALIEGTMFFMLLISLVISVVYAVKTNEFKKDKDFFEKVGKDARYIGYGALIMFFYILFVTAFSRSNIGEVFTSLLANGLDKANFSGFPLLILSMIIIALTGFLLPSTYMKWSIISPILIPKMNVSNMTAPFALFIFKASDAISKGFTPLFGGFIIYLIYLNVFNKDEKTITITKSLGYLKNYFWIMMISWFAMALFSYILGIPIGPGARPLS